MLVHPVVAHIDPDSARVLSRPVQLAQVTGRDTLGIIEMTERHTDAAHELGVSVFLLDLAHVRHMVLPALSLAETSVPDDLGGLLMLDAVWDLNSDGPLASGRMRVVEPSGYGAAADSIIARFDLDADEFRIRSARVRSGGDALTISGGIGTTTDTIGIHVRTRRLDLVRVLEPLLPPLKRIEPPAPWPSALPIPGATQHLQSLPTSMSGEELNRPLAAFDALLRAGHPMPDHGLAATLPLYADIRYGGPSSSPLLSGSAGFVGGFLDLQAIVEPFWFLDSLLVRFDDRMLRVPQFPVNVGTEGRDIRLASTYSLDDGEFDLRVLADHARFTVISADQVALPRLLRRLKLGPVISPILDARVTDPIGTFTLDTDIHWRGNADASQLTGDVQLYRSIFSYPLPEAQDMLASMASSTTVTSAPDLMPNVDMHIAITTEDSLVIENNISSGATAGFQLALHGFGEYPKLQGDAGVSSGSPIRYFGRDFIVSSASISFQDPDVFEPTVDAMATASFVGADGETPFRVEFTASGAFPDRFVTEMVAYEGPEAEQTVILDQQQILKILLFGSSEFALQADQRFNNFLSQRGYGAASAALGTMLPLDRVSVQERELESSADADDTQSVTELELAQSFRFFGQTVRVSMATPVGEISQFGYQRAEARWYILQRPRLMRNLESLSLTFGTQAPDETGDVVAKETSLDVQVRIRF